MKKLHLILSLLSILTIMSLVISCNNQRKTEILQSLNKEKVNSSPSNDFPIFPKGTIFNERVEDGKKVIDVTLPDGYLFRIDGRVEEGSTTFTCDCSGSGSCFPALYIDVSGNIQPRCMVAECTQNCKRVTRTKSQRGFKESTVDIEIGVPSVVKFMEESLNAKHVKGEKYKKIKPIVSYTRISKMSSVTHSDITEDVKKEMNMLVEEMYEVNELGEPEFAYPTIYDNGEVPKGYTYLPLEVNNRIMLMVIPANKTMIDYSFRALATQKDSPPDGIGCSGTCQASRCKMTRASGGSNGDYFLFCTGCGDAQCFITY